MAEELWERLGRGYSVHQQTWPKFDASAVVAETITIPVQVNGKLRDRITVPADADEAAIKDAALASEVVQKFLDGKPLRQVIYAKGRMLNLLV
jgi:leucyl-tRNA synthetase